MGNGAMPAKHRNRTIALTQGLLKVGGVLSSTPPILFFYNPRYMRTSPSSVALGLFHATPLILIKIATFILLTIKGKDILSCNHPFRNEKQKESPPSGRFSAVMLPPWKRMALRTMERPSPEPVSEEEVEASEERVRPSSVR